MQHFAAGRQPFYARRTRSPTQMLRKLRRYIVGVQINYHCCLRLRTAHTGCLRRTEAN